MHKLALTIACVTERLTLDYKELNMILVVMWSMMSYLNPKIMSTSSDFLVVCHL